MLHKKVIFFLMLIVMSAVLFIGDKLCTGTTYNHSEVTALNKCTSLIDFFLTGLITSDNLLEEERRNFPEKIETEEQLEDCSLSDFEFIPFAFTAVVQDFCFLDFDINSKYPENNSPPPKLA